VNVRLQCGSSVTSNELAAQMGVTCATNGRKNDMRGVHIQTMLALKRVMLTQFRHRDVTQVD